jgi:predicted transcriptional regulator
VDDETYQAIRRLADKGNRNVSDVVRDAIRRFLEAS